MGDEICVPSPSSSPSSDNTNNVASVEKFKEISEIHANLIKLRKEKGRERDFLGQCETFSRFFAVYFFLFD